MAGRRRFKSRELSPDDLEAEFFGCIATLDELSASFEKGLVESTVYRKQHRSLVKDAYKIRQNLDGTGFNLQTFLERESIAERFPRGAKAVQLLEGDDSVDGEKVAFMPFEKLKRLPQQASEFVSNSIELVDMLRLRTVARVEFLIPALDAMKAVMTDYPGFGEDSSEFKEIVDWLQVLEKKKPSEILEGRVAENLELSATRWLNEFRRKLRS